MARLTKDDILSIKDLKSETVEVPEWGGEVLVQAVSAIGREKLLSAIHAVDKAVAGNLNKFLAWTKDRPSGC